MLRLGLTKLALDEAVAGDNEDTGTESEAAKQMRTGLMKSLRQHFEEEEDGMQVDKVDEDAKMEE
jgi:SWI/SNF-related matrix-associated actin-dependent regulator 1 of chromatin subfamily A